LDNQVSLDISNLTKEEREAAKDEKEARKAKWIIE
jgi:hypothetical protein